MKNSKNVLQTFGIVLGGALLGIAVIVHAVVAYGFVLSKVWSWFVVPALGVPALGVGAAIGVAFVVNVLLSNIKNAIATKQEGPKKSPGDVLAGVLLDPWITLLVGYVLHVIIN